MAEVSPPSSTIPSTPGPTSSSPPPEVPSRSEFEERIVELRKLFLSKHERIVDWWLNVIAILLTLFGFGVIIGGYLSFSELYDAHERLDSMEKESKQHLDDAEQYLSEIRRIYYDLVITNMKAKANLEQSERDTRAISRMRRRSQRGSGGTSSR